MKKVLVVVLALVMVLSMTACGGSGLTGSWKFTSMELDGKNGFDEDGVNILKKLEEKGFFLGLCAKSDNTGYMNYGQGKVDLKWDKANVTIDNKSVPYTISGDTLTIESKEDKTKMVFKKMTSDEATKFESQTDETLGKAMLEIAKDLAGAGSEDDEE